MITIPARPNWGELLDQAPTDNDLENIANLMWVPLERRGMSELVHRLMESDNPDVATLATHWFYLPDPEPFAWVERK